MISLEFITGHVNYNNPAYTYKFQLKTTKKIEEKEEPKDPDISFK